MDVCHTWPPLMELVRAQTVPANFSSTNESIMKYSPPTRTSLKNIRVKILEKSS